MSKIRLDLFDGSKIDRGRSRPIEALWHLVRCLFFSTSFPWPYSIKRGWLRLFGAKIGKGVVLRPRIHVHFPWKLTVGDFCWIGEGTQLLNIAPITLENHVALAHEVYLAAAGHDIGSATMAPKNLPILVRSGTWIATRAFVGPGVTINEDVVVAAGAVVVKDVPPGVVVGGNPARIIRPRLIERP